MRYPAKTDVAVLMLFFTRSETLQQVFDAVRQARPSHLFLFQDGPRSDADRAGIEACRRIVSDDKIDWECDVQRNYQTHNLGCDPAGYISHQWAFSLAEKVVVLEDDVVPSQGFLPFCKEMLDRYEHDERIGMIAGFNIDERTSDVASSYFFTSEFSIWGWASWRRVALQWDDTYGFIKDEQAVQQLKVLAKSRCLRKSALKMFRDHSQSGKAYFETIYWSELLLNSRLTVMPSVNMISNVGLTADSTHFSANLQTTPHRLRRIFTMKRHDLELPLRHPLHVTDHIAYKERLYHTMAWNHPWLKVADSMEELWLNLRYGNFRRIWQAVGCRVDKWTGRSKWK